MSRLALVSTSGFPGGSWVKNPPASQEMWVRSLRQEDALEKEMARGAWEATVLGITRVGHNLATKQQQQTNDNASIIEQF